ncbi:putative triacylglyceride transporter [Nocardioides baekrokdamisoli]|uniref:Putative triacylglyceride transporter n=1 Tax=Nocardioides baekrokdamisoli TaxID=1804624 RepID=A0A3G9IV92_9ACTN|nr:MFS transporter [Nocardioides baekrokdamisoli]BBH16193.1 putative triacylglyceride transporter [Nocardioides baekrokdamisoli]
MALPSEGPANRRPWPLILASIAVAYAAADTYVAVVALQPMMHSVGLEETQIQKAAPIVSGFLLGYVAMLPLIGRIADVRGRIPVLRWGLFLFSFGSIITAVAYSMPTLIAGRFLQGIGGGALVPATLALVADLYPAGRRAVPLGIVSAVQEAGSVLGPMLGAAILAVSSWRGIFWVNVAVGAALWLGLSASAARTRRRVDWIGLALAILLAIGVYLVLHPPMSIKQDIFWGEIYVPHGSSPRWTTDVGLVTVGIAVVLLAWCLLGRSAAVNLRDWARATREVDLIGAGILGVSLGGIVIAFASADPQIQMVSSTGWMWLAGSAIAAALFVIRCRVAKAPLIPRGALGAVPAWGGLVISLLVGVTLVTALVTVPAFAQTDGNDSPTRAAFVLVRLLVALPFGAYLGGLLTHRTSPRLVGSLGLLCATVGLWLMSNWQHGALDHASATVALVVAGFGFGLVLAPVNTAVLGATPSDVHGLASALTVVARMIGMLVGVSFLTVLALHTLYADAPSVESVCHSTTVCDAYGNQLAASAVTPMRAMFRGAFWVGLFASAAAAVLLGRSPAHRPE